MLQSIPLQQQPQSSQYFTPHCHTANPGKWEGSNGGKIQRRGKKSKREDGGGGDSSDLMTFREGAHFDEYFNVILL